MLCSLKTHRPDKLLQKRLLQLAYSLIALAAAIILFMVYPEYYLYLILSMLILCIFCLALTIKTLRAGEEAISYGRTTSPENCSKTNRFSNIWRSSSAKTVSTKRLSTACKPPAATLPPKKSRWH